MANEVEGQSGLESGVLRYPQYNFRVYFDKVFIYEGIDEKNGLLYQVDWIYAVE